MELRVGGHFLLVGDMPFLYHLESAAVKSFRLLIPVVAMSVAFAGCGPRHLPPESPLDTPQAHYQTGLERFERGDLWIAEAEFERARSLDPDFAGTFVGSALIAMNHQDFWQAYQELEQALHRDRSFTDAYVVRGRVTTAEGVTKEISVEAWLPTALKAYEQAAKLDPLRPDIYFHRGRTLLKANDLERARKAFTEVIRLNTGALVPKALAQVERIQAIERAVPGSKSGIKIALVDEITRAELAVLLLEELRLADLTEQRGKTAPQVKFSPPGQGQKANVHPVDVVASWARPWIEEVLALAVPGFELMPDLTFRPDEPVTRANYARVNEGILVLITGDSGLATRYVGGNSPFPDVQSDSYAYNAIALNVDRGIISSDKISGRFRLNDTVSGAEALLIVRELQNAVRMEF